MQGRKQKDGKKKQGQTLQASYTVEAALVFSITFFVLAAFFVLSFYVHDRAVMQSMVCEAALAGSNSVTQSDRTKAADQVRKNIKQKRFLGSRNLTGNVSSGEKQAMASWKAVYPVPGFAAKYFSKGYLQIQASWNSQVFHPSETIRKIRGAGEFLTGGEQ